MAKLCNLLICKVTFFLFSLFFQKLAASDNFFRLSYDNQCAVYSFLWEEDNPETFCSHLVYFSMTSKVYGQLVDNYITQLFINNDIDFSLIIVNKTYEKLLMNSKLANFFIHKTPLHFFIDQIVNVQNKIVVLEQQDSDIYESFDKISYVNKGYSWLLKKSAAKDKAEKKIFLLQQSIDDAIKDTEAKIKDYTPLIMLGNEELKKQDVLKKSIESEIARFKKYLYHYGLLMNNDYFKEALKYNNISDFSPEKFSYSCYSYWLSYKNIFYTKKNILEAFVIAKLLYHNYLEYKEFAEKLLIQVANDVSNELLQKETIISGIHDFFNMHILPLIVEIDTEKIINQLNLKKCFTITVLKHFYNTYNTSLLNNYPKEDWLYCQKKALLFFSYENDFHINRNDFYIKLPSLIVAERNDVVDINGDLLSKLIFDNMNGAYRNSFKNFCEPLIHICSPSVIVRFSYLRECKHNLDNLCRIALTKKKIIIKIDNGIAPLLPNDNNYISSANQRFLHEVATNGYGNEKSIQFEVPIGKMKEYQNAVLKYKHIYYWLYFLNKNIAEIYKKNDEFDNTGHAITLGAILLFYSMQVLYNIGLRKHYYMFANSAFGILRTVFFLQKIVFPKEIERNPIIPWHLIDILMQDAFFLHALWHRDVDLVLLVQNFGYWCAFEKTVFWIPFLSKIYYYATMGDKKIMIGKA